jgi:glycosyltransferase involved in cell wall biosynthesis
MKLRILSFLERRGIRESSRILILPYQTLYLKNLGIKDNKYSYIYCGIETNKYKSIETLLGRAIKEKFDVDFIFFHPTRHEWGDAKKIDKGNDKLIFAFSRFIKITGKKALLIFIEKGSDIIKSKKMISGLGLQKNVLWLKPMNKKNLIEYYSISDIVFNEFVIGEGIGQIDLESLSVGIPTFRYFKNYENYYKELPPIINVFTADDIVSEMIRLTDSYDYRVEIGKKSREWILKHHDWDIVTDKYISLYEEILGTKRFFT